MELHFPEYIGRWSPKDVLGGFWDIGSLVTIALSDVLIDKKSIKLNHIRQLITVLNQILQRRNEFLAKYKVLLSLSPCARVRVRA